MKDQASLNLLIVDSPIDSKALTGHLMLRATSSGLKVYDATGSETELGGGGGGETTWDAITGKPESFTPSTHTHAIGDITSLQTTLDNKVVKGDNNTLGSTNFGLQTSTGTISFATNSGAISFGTVSGGIHLACFQSELMLDGGDVLLNGDGIKFNSHALNTANGLVQLDSSGKIPSNLYEQTSGGSSVTVGSGLTGSGSTESPLKLNLYDYTDSAGILITTSGICTINVERGNDFHFGREECKVASSGSSLILSSSDTVILSAPIIDVTSSNVRLNAAAANTAGGFAIVGSDGKLPSTILPESTGGDTTQLESRVSALEGTVGTLDAAVDEILADYGEGSGALPYRVVASATEPENPTEGMIWIQTE